MVTSSFGEQDVVAVVGERFAVSLALDGVGGLDRGVHGGFDGAKLLDEFNGTLVADARRARDVVDGVAAKGHHVDDAPVVGTRRVSARHRRNQG